MVQVPAAVRQDTSRAPSLHREVSLCELLDRVLNKGAVLTGEIVITVADVELLYVGLSLLVCAVETLLQPPPGEVTE